MLLMSCQAQDVITGKKARRVQTAPAGLAGARVKKKFDLIVIGGGSAGLAHAQRAAEHGADVAVIENGPLGGTCVNVGCVPKKVMWYSASYARSVRLAADYGFDLTVNGHDWSALKQRRDAYVARLNAFIRKVSTEGVSNSSGEPGASSTRTRFGLRVTTIAPITL